MSLTKYGHGHIWSIMNITQDPHLACLQTEVYLPCHLVAAALHSHIGAPLILGPTTGNNK